MAPPSPCAFGHTCTPFAERVSLISAARKLCAQNGRMDQLRCTHLSLRPKFAKPREQICLSPSFICAFTAQTFTTKARGRVECLSPLFSGRGVASYVQGDPNDQHHHHHLVPRKLVLADSRDAQLSADSQHRQTYLVPREREREAALAGGPAAVVQEEEGDDSVFLDDNEPSSFVHILVNDGQQVRYFRNAREAAAVQQQQEVGQATVPSLGQSSTAQVSGVCQLTDRTSPSHGGGATGGRDQLEAATDDADDEARPLLDGPQREGPQLLREPTANKKPAGTPGNTTPKLPQAILQTYTVPVDETEATSEDDIVPTMTQRFNREREE